MSWAVIGTVATVVLAASAAAGVSYTVYSATNPPKTKEQATQALSRNSAQLTKLQAKRAEFAAKPESAGNTKKVKNIDDAISKVQGSITFLTNWITTNGNTPAPTTADKKFVELTDKNKALLASSNTSSGNAGAVIQTPSTSNHYGLIGIIGGAFLLVVFIALMVFGKHKKHR